MTEERDQIVAKLRDLEVRFRDTASLLSRMSESSYKTGRFEAYMEGAFAVESLLKEIDPDSLIPVEQPLTWHSDYLEFAEASSESLSRGMIRKCLQCQRCKAGMETEIVKGEPATKKRIQCGCGHVQLVSFFQNGQ